MVLSYLIPISMGWSQPSTAAITVMLIAGAGGVSESISKGFMRVIGTILGAIIGLALIALFPQERVLYLLSLSLVLALIIYSYYAYQGDSSIFMLCAMVIMIIFVHGPQNAFLYGIDRTIMTLFGILVYTFIGVFIWPIKSIVQTQQTRAVNFIFLDTDNFKATLQLLTIFFTSVPFWIYFNPPGGFLLVTLATLLGLFTTFTPLKPSLLMILLSFGFLFSTVMYIFVLPNLIYAWELALFIFTYTFIAFYFLNPKITIFFLLGMFLLGIDNTMNYNFALFLNILLVFYIFLIILILFHNFPFSTKPEHLFLSSKKRFFKHLSALNKTNNRKKVEFHRFYLTHLIKKMRLWASKIDYNYFDNFSQTQLNSFIDECELIISQKNDIILNLDKLNNNLNKQNIDWTTLKATRF